jgi:S-formylglutathione hydrolase
MIKAGAQRFAAREGLMLIAPDTSPRDAGIPGESENWDF